MKKFTMILISVFMMGSLIAQQAEGPAGNYGSLGASASVLYSQMNPYTGGAHGGVVASQQFTDINNDIAQVADDFMVPAGMTWNITDISVFGNYFGDSTGPATSFQVQIYSDNAGLPGSIISDQNIAMWSENGGVFAFGLTTPVSLTTGHYWVSVYSVQDYTEDGQWGWSWNADDQINTEVSNMDPNNVLSENWPVTWTNGTVTWPQHSSLDVCFELQGDESTTPVIPVSNWAIVLGVFLIGAFMVIRYRRTLA